MARHTGRAGLAGLCNVSLSRGISRKGSLYPSRLTCRGISRVACSTSSSSLSASRYNALVISACIGYSVIGFKSSVSENIIGETESYKQNAEINIPPLPTS